MRCLATTKSVTPAKAGVHLTHENAERPMDSGFRRNDTLVLSAEKLRRNNPLHRPRLQRHLAFGIREDRLHIGLRLRDVEHMALA